MLNENLLSAVAMSGYANLLVWFFLATFSFIKLRLPVYHPFAIHLLYHLLGFVIRPFSIVSTGQSFLWTRIGYTPTTGDIYIASLIANIALLATFVGMLIGSKLNKSILPKPTPFQIEIHHRHKFVIAVVTLVLLGLYANYKALSGTGLDNVLAYERIVDSAGGAHLLGTSGYVTALAEFLPPICILMFMIPRLRLWAFALTLSYVGLRMFAGAQRLSFIIVIVGVFYYYLITKGRRYPTASAIIFFVLVGYVFDVIGGDRYAVRRLVMGTSNLTDIVETHRATRGENALTSDLVEYDVSTATIAMINDNDAWSFGTQYLRILIWPIPRQLWLDKPVFTNIINLNDYGDFRYLTIGVYADTYMAFSFISLIIMMGGLGFFFARMYNVLITSYSVNSLLFYWVVLIFTKTILRDGGVTALYFWIFSMLPIVIITYAGGLRICRLKMV